MVKTKAVSRQSLIKKQFQLVGAYGSYRYAISLETTVTSMSYHTEMKHTSTEKQLE